MTAIPITTAEPTTTGGALPHYRGRSFTGRNASASPDAPEQQFAGREDANSAAGFKGRPQGIGGMFTAAGEKGGDASMLTKVGGIGLVARLPRHHAEHGYPDERSPRQEGCGRTEGRP